MRSPSTSNSTSLSFATDAQSRQSLSVFFEISIFCPHITAQLLSVCDISKSIELTVSLFGASSRGIFISKSDLTVPCAVMIFLSRVSFAGVQTGFLPLTVLSLSVNAKVLIS